MTTLGAEVRTLAVLGVPTRQGVSRSVVGLAAALLAPTLVFLLVFTYWPLVVSVVGSFQRFSPTGTVPRWVGLQNYRDLWRDALFRQMLVNTALYVVIVGPLAVLMGLSSTRSPSCR